MPTPSESSSQIKLEASSKTDSPIQLGAQANTKDCVSYKSAEACKEFSAGVSMEESILKATVKTLFTATGAKKDIHVDNPLPGINKVELSAKAGHVEAGAE